MYALFVIFLLRYAHRVEKDPSLSPVSEEDLANRERYRHLQLDTLENRLAWASHGADSCFSWL